MGKERGTCLRIKITLGCAESKPLGPLCEQEWRHGGAVTGLCGKTHPSRRLARSRRGVNPVVSSPGLTPALSDSDVGILAHHSRDIDTERLIPHGTKA